MRVVLLVLGDLRPYYFSVIGNFRPYVMTRLGNYFRDIVD